VQVAKGAAAHSGLRSVFQPRSLSDLAVLGLGVLGYDDKAEAVVCSFPSAKEGMLLVRCDQKLVI